MTSRNDRPWIRLPVLSELFWFATLVATGPARWNERPSVGPARAKVAWRSSTTLRWSCTSLGATLASTRISAAWSFGETFATCTFVTFGTALASATSRAIAA
nr:hypothetical protein [Aciditerrimonas ferrireducens]